MGLLSTLATLCVELTADTSKLDAKMAEAVHTGQRMGSAAGAGFAQGFNNPIIGAISHVRDLENSLGDIANVASIVLGSRAAAEMGAYRRQLQAIAGDADKAGAAFSKFQQIASKSNYNLDQVFSFGIGQAGRTGDVKGAADETQKLLNAATVFGVSNKDFENFQYNTSQIQNKGAGKVEADDLRQFKNAAPLATKMIADAYGISIKAATTKLNAATGDQFIKILEKVGDKHPTAAADAAAKDPYSAAANVMDDFNNAMESTGRIVNQTLTPAIKNVGELVQDFGHINEATGGWAGVAAVIGIGGLAIKRFGGDMMQTAGATVRMGVTLESLDATILQLTASVRMLAGASEIATMATRAETLAEEQKAMASGGNAIRAFLPGKGGGGIALAEGGAAAGGLKGLVGKVGGAGNAIAMVGFAATVVGSQISQSHPTAGGLLEGAGSGAVMGAQIGMLFGPEGAIVGGIAGAIVGAIPAAAKGLDDHYGKGTANKIGAEITKGVIGPWALIPALGKGIDHLFEVDKDKKDKNGKALDDHAKAMDEHTTALKSSARSIGGGKRAAGVVSQIEMEYSVYALMHSGQVGIG